MIFILSVTTSEAAADCETLSRVKCVNSCLHCKRNKKGVETKSDVLIRKKSTKKKSSSAPPVVRFIMYEDLALQTPWWRNPIIKSLVDAWRHIY